MSRIARARTSGRFSSKCWGIYKRCAPVTRAGGNHFGGPVYGRNVAPARQGDERYPADLRSRYLCSPESTSSERWLWIDAAMTTTPVVRWGISAVMTSSG